MLKVIWFSLALTGLFSVTIGVTLWMLATDREPGARRSIAVTTAPPLSAATATPSLTAATSAPSSTAATAAPSSNLAAPAPSSNVAMPVAVPAASVSEVEKKGFEYAAKRETSWRLFTKKSELTDKTEVAVRSLQKNEQGAFAEVEGACKNGYVVFAAGIFDSQSRGTVTFPWSSDSSGTLFVVTTARINDNQPTTSIAMASPTSHRNRITLAILFWMKFDPIELLRSNPTMNIEPLATTWRALIQFETSMGKMLVKIPVYDENIQSWIKSCSSGQAN